ncbi:MAG: c-type cytochrome [Cyclobacteriaceae bacterium]
MQFKVGLIFSLAILASCQPSFDEYIPDLSEYQIEKGFEVSIIAAEPLIEAPVVIDFDNQGRIWAVEMRGYMRDIDGSTENEPSGVISILEDRDEDGIIDNSKVFLDSLVMPRAMALVYGGLLYVESPNLWFVEINEDKPGKKTLIDSLYSAGGNPEHQPNGLMMGIDNWIYNANSKSRYQFKDGIWYREATSSRGQWGITKDDFGRLYTNNNSTLLKGDYVLPNLLIRNRNFKPNNGINKTLDKNQKVYPLQPNPVNRGYIPGVLNEDSILVRTTSACGPLVYRGGQFPNEYDQNAFICVPEGNLIKRNTLSFDADIVKADQPWDDKEFLTSTDKAFRPVSLYNSPDGAIYILDMHRGVIQHNAFLSPYLREQIKKQSLDTILGMGRILKVKKQGQLEAEVSNFDRLSVTDLVALLQDQNGWIRDRAQHYLVYKKQIGAVEELQALAKDGSLPFSQIHALHSLNGLESLSFELLSKVAENGAPEVCAHALVLLTDFVDETRKEQALQLAQNLLNRNDPTIDLYLSATLGSWSRIAANQIFSLLNQLSDKYSVKPLYQDAILSGLANYEEQYMAFVQNNDGPVEDYLSEQLALTVDNRANGKENSIYAPVINREGGRTKGMKLYKSICSACHGIDGLGIDGLAPPLMKSEYVTIGAERLGLVILHGLHGPITVKGKRYELNTVMPGLIHNESMTDKDISAIISFVTNAFSEIPKGLKADKVKELRAMKPKDSAGYTEEELNGLKFD